MEYKEKIKTQVPKTEDGQVGIRATLNNMGFSDKDIGYDQATNTVTLKGRPFMTPGYLDNNAGVSYARESDIQKSVADFYKDSNNPVVRVSDAYANTAGKYGLSADALTYGNGIVSIGGSPLDILYIDDSGKAWGRQNTISSAVENYARKSGIESPSSILDRYENTYLKDINNMIKALENREEFSYDPDADPVFQAYKNKYQLEGERASREAMASYSALTGGYVNSAAATAGANASLYYGKQLTDTLPELAQMAYDRYAEKYQADLDLLNQKMDLYDTAYKNALAANMAQTENANYSSASNVARDNAERAKNIEDSRLYWDEIFNTLDLEKANYTNEGLALSNLQKQIYNQYYERLLNAEILGQELTNSAKMAKLN